MARRLVRGLVKRASVGILVVIAAIMGGEGVCVLERWGWKRRRRAPPPPPRAHDSGALDCAS